MTDYRRTEEEIWEEDVAEDERPTNVLPLFAVSGRPAGAELAPSADSREPSVEPDATTSALRPLEARPVQVGSEDELDERITLERTPGRAPDPPVESPLASDGSDPSQSDELLEVRPLPPPAPLPSMMLGPNMSTRGDITERVSTIPRTHPFANSLAPGGSLVTLPPRRADHTRWYGLGAAALLALAAMGALLLQSRGEHHGAVRFDDERARLPVLASEEAVIVVEDSPAPVLLGDENDCTSVHARADLALAEAALLPTQAADLRPRATPVRPAPAKLARMEAAAEPSGPRAMPVVVGSVQLGGAATASDSPVPDRDAVTQAMDRLGADLRSCVGDEHGVADVTLTVRGNGAVTHALVEGAFAGSEKGTCIARTLRGARLPSFSQPVLHIAYPLKL